MPWYQFENGLRTCSSNSTFNFQDISYKQKCGFPVGSPLSPIAGDIVMDDLEINCISTLPFQLPFYFRYVDDIITAVPANQIDTIKNSFNSYFHKIQFTVEEESDNTIRFLDVLIIRVGTNIRTNWHQKPSLYTSQVSSHTHTHKYVLLPYVQGLSEKLSGILKPFNIKIASRNTNDLALFFKSAKDTVPKLDMADVYNIPCSGCTATHIGITKRPLKTRIEEHKKDVYNPPVNGPLSPNMHGTNSIHSTLTI